MMKLEFGIYQAYMTHMMAYNVEQLCEEAVFIGMQLQFCSIVE
jgi:hypothetical protein